MSNEIKLHDKVFVKYIDRKKIRNRIKEISDSVNTDYHDKNPVFLIVLKGAAFFAMDVIKRFDAHCEVEMIRSTSYLGTGFSGKLLLSMNENLKLTNRHVIIVEDIIDTGRTLTAIKNWLEDHGAASVSVMSLLYKPEAVEFDVDIRYLGFEVPKEFLVGYGLDYDQLGRNLRDIYILKTGD